MDVKELTDLLVSSCESNRCKYIPWWEDSKESSNSIYRFNVFTDEQIQDIEECINGCSVDIISKPAGNMGLSLFHMLVWHNFYNSVKKILEGADIDINITDCKGRGITPLMLACCYGNFAMAELLIQNGADGAICSQDGKNAYHYLACHYIRGIQYAYECQGKSLEQREDIARLLPDCINKKDINGMTPLVFMLNGSNTNISWALSDVFIEKGADIDYIDGNGNTLLMMAIYNQHITAAFRLIECGVDVNKKNNEGETPLQLAKKCYNDALCMFLKENGAEGDCEAGNMDLNNFSRITSNAFASISEDNRDNITTALYLSKKLISQVDTDDDDEIRCISNIFYSAMMNDKRYQVIDICMDYGIDFTAPIHSGGIVTCLRDECLAGNYGTGIIEKLAGLGIDMDKPLIKGRTPACIVASLHKRNMIYGGKDDYFENAAKLFSRESMEYVDNSGTTALHWAARNNHYDMLRIMIEKGVDVNITEDSPATPGNTPLHTACIYGNTEAVKILEESGADDSIQNVDGEIPAHLAVMKSKFGRDLKQEDRAAVIKELKNIDIARNDGKTPLMLLQYMDINTNMAILPLFLEKGADVNHTDNNGNTALILNAQNFCYKGVVKELVRAGADVNVSNNSGDNALHYALRYGNQEAARFLIKKGADYNKTDNQGITPLQIAVEKGYDTLLDIMDSIQG